MDTLSRGQALLRLAAIGGGVAATAMTPFPAGATGATESTRQMSGYFFGRIAAALPVLFVISLLAFGIEAATPGDPAYLLLRAAGIETITPNWWRPSAPNSTWTTRSRCAISTG